MSGLILGAGLKLQKVDRPIKGGPFWKSRFWLVSWLPLKQMTKLTKGLHSFAIDCFIRCFVKCHRQKLFPLVSYELFRSWETTKNHGNISERQWEGVKLRGKSFWKRTMVRLDCGRSLDKNPDRPLKPRRALTTWLRSSRQTFGRETIRTLPIPSRNTTWPRCRKQRFEEDWRRRVFERLLQFLTC